jgi:prepilin-type N-terminal cleavage/methylation domain-containing protein
MRDTNSRASHQGTRRIQGRRRRGDSSGFTLVEFLVVLAVIAILAAIGVARINAPDARLFSNDLRAALEQARYEAVRRHTPIAFTGGATGFATREPTGALDTVTKVFESGICTSGTPLRIKGLTDYRGITVTGGLSSTGVVWLPSGLPRACDGSDLPTALTTTIGDGRSTYRVILSGAGAVEVATP